LNRTIYRKIVLFILYRVRSLNQAKNQWFLDEKYSFKKKGRVYKILRRELYKFGRYDVVKRCPAAGITVKWGKMTSEKRKLPL